MKDSARDCRIPLLRFWERTIWEIYMPRIEGCLGSLNESQIWWRPHPACNSAGNLVLHLQGNVRQWIVSGLGGKEDIRKRDREFSEAGPIAGQALLAGLRRTTREARAVIRRLSERDLRRSYRIQGFSVTGIEAVLHVTEHFSHHAGQIIYITKLLAGKDLGFTHLPGDKSKKRTPRLRAV